MYKKIAVISIIIILTIINLSIYAKEQHLAKGQIVYLDFAPVDPRSIMQGDYMDLQLRITNDLYKALPKIKSKKNRKKSIALYQGSAVAFLDKKILQNFKAFITIRKFNKMKFFYILVSEIIE